MIDLHTRTAPRIVRGACAGVALLAVASVAPAQQPLELRIGTVTSPVTNHPSATGTLPAPFKLVGGGARANWSTYGSLLTATQPGAPGSNAWTAGSKDHFAAEPVSITAFAIGLADPADDWEVIVREARAAIGPKPTATATLPTGYVMTGGGCLDDWRATPNAPGNLLTASFPSSTNSWECRGQEHAGASPASIVAYVIGIRPKKPGVPLPELQITTAASQVGAHVSALAPALPGFIVTGGGAVTRGSNTITLGTQPSAGRAIGGRAPATAATEAGQLLTASFPEVPAGATSANGWRAAAKDHVHTSPGVVEAYALNLRFPPPALVAQTVLIPGLLRLRWSLNPEAPPSIAPNSKVLLFVHGMDSRAEEADGFTKALFRTVTATPVAPPAALPPIAANRVTVNFTSCPNPASGCPETCDNPDNFSSGQRTGIVPLEVVNGAPTRVYFAPVTPPRLLDMTPPPGTPIAAGAQINVPAARNIGANEGRLIAELRAAAAAAQPLNSLRLAAARFSAGDPVLGNAFADLSATGRRSFAAFRQALPGEAFCQSLGGPNIQNGCRTALDRAYRVANFLRTGQRGDTPALKAAKVAERNALGWIAVSGEDDSPHRPVNVPSSDFPQYDLVVVVPTPLSGASQVLPVRTRYTIAQSQTPGNNLVVIGMDLPTSGYADNLDYNLVSRLELIGAPRRLPLTNDPYDFAASGATPLLDFIETFIVVFANTLDRSVPIKNNIKAVMGGSLGGNMTFRLGRLPNVPWLPRFVVWSPASIWDSLGAGSDLTKHQGPLHGWLRANQAMTAPGVGDHAAFFATWDQPIVKVVIPMAQSDTWTSDFYPCKKSGVAGARLDRQETYDRLFLAWHWRLGAEQLLFSHQNRDASNRPLFMSNVKPMLLACGVEDRVPWNDICPATQNTAQQMSATPGKALFLGQTGHSVDGERHSFFAREVVQFLGL